MKFSGENSNNLHLSIFLYDEPSSKTLNLKEIRNYLKDKLGNIDVRIRKDFITFHLNSKDIDEYASIFI